MASILWLPVVFALCSALLYWLSTTLPALPTAVTGVSSAALRFPSTLDELRDLAALLDHYRANHMCHVLALYGAAYLFKQTFAVPGSIFLNLLGGALFGQWVGFLLTCLLSASGATCCFLLAKVCGRSYIVRYFPDQLRLVQAKIKQNSDSLFFFLMFLRLFPMTPNWFLNMASPICGVPTHLFFLSVFFGLMPYNFISVQTGSILSQLTSMDTIFTPWTMVKLFTMATAALVPGICIKRYQEYRSSKKEALTFAPVMYPELVENIGTSTDLSLHREEGDVKAATNPVTNPAKMECLASGEESEPKTVSANVRQRKVLKTKIQVTEIAEIPMFSRKAHKESLRGRTQPLCVGRPVLPRQNITETPLLVDTSTQLVRATGNDTMSTVLMGPETLVERIKDACQLTTTELGCSVAPLIVQGTTNRGETSCQIESSADELDTVLTEDSGENVQSRATLEDGLVIEEESEKRAAGSQSESLKETLDPSLSSQNLAEDLAQIESSQEQSQGSGEEGWATEEEDAKEGKEETPQHLTSLPRSSRKKCKRKSRTCKVTKSCQVTSSSSSQQDQKITEPDKAISVGDRSLAEESKILVLQKRECAERQIHDELTNVAEVLSSEDPVSEEDGIKKGMEGQVGCVPSVEDGVSRNVADSDGKASANIDVGQETTRNENHPETECQNSVQHSDSVSRSENIGMNRNFIEELPQLVISDKTVTEDLCPVQRTDIPESLLESGLQCPEVSKETEITGVVTDPAASRTMIEEEREPKTTSQVKTSTEVNSSTDKKFQ